VAQAPEDLAAVALCSPPAAAAAATTPVSPIT